MSEPLDRHRSGNILGVSLVEFFWGLGMPVIFDSTFLPLFLWTLGASSFLIGLIPTCISAGSALFSLASGLLTARLTRKRPAVIAVHLVESAPIFLFGLILLVFGFVPSTLAIFFLAFTVFCLGNGMTLPVWQNYTVRIFSQTSAIFALGVMLVSQSAAKLASGFLLLGIVERFSFSSQGAGLVFTMAGGLFIIGSFFFLLTREPEPPPAAAQALAEPPLEQLRKAWTLLRNRNFLFLLATDLEYFALTGVIAFYGNFAVKYAGIAPATVSGLFVVFNHLGGITANLLLGWLGLLRLKGKLLLAKSLSMLAMILVCLARPAAIFYLASFSFGISRGTRFLVFPPAVKRLSRQEDATLFFAVGSLISLPFSAGIPLVNGWLLDRFAFLGPWSYCGVFLAMAALSLASLYFVSRVDFLEDKGGPPGISSRPGDAGPPVPPGPGPSRFPR